MATIAIAKENKNLIEAHQRRSLSSSVVTLVIQCYSRHGTMFDAGDSAERMNIPPHLYSSED